MNNISVKPYTTLQNKDFHSVVNLSVNNSDFTSVKAKDNQVEYHISKCYFRTIIIENFEDIDFKNININFYGCCVERIEVENIKTKNISISFGHSIIGGTIVNNSIESVDIFNCLVYDNLFLINQKKVRVLYQESTIYLRLWKNIFSKLSVNDPSWVLGKNQSFFFYDCNKVDFKVDALEVIKKRVYRNHYQNHEDFHLGYYISKEELELFNISINIKYSPNVENSETSITGARLKSLELYGHSTGKINIENTKIESWYIRDFSTDKEAVFYDILPLVKTSKESKIEIHKSNLDKTWFDNVNFDEYNLVSFYRTRIGKATFTSCNFPETYANFEKFRAIKNVHYPYQKQDNYYKDQYETFLQLKASLESTNNFYEAQKFQSISNDALNKIESISKWDKTILWFNRESNNHGISIARPFWLFWGCGIILYFFYLVSLGYVFNNKDFDWYLWGSFFSFLDITHKPDFLVEKKCLTGWSQFFDFVSKAVLGYIIFQFVAAFRKYGKNK